MYAAQIVLICANISGHTRLIGSIAATTPHSGRPGGRAIGYTGPSTEAGVNADSHFRSSPDPSYSLTTVVCLLVLT